MSFFAGNGKLHITQNARTIGELDSSTIYPDTTFHSDMNVICSQGEYIAQSYLANFNVRHGDFPASAVLPEQCYEVELPQAVVNALGNNQVVLVQIDTGDAESPINFPINIKTGITGQVDPGRWDRAVAIAPQVTVGGRFDVCFSQTSIKNANISPTLSSIGNSGQINETTGKTEPTTYVMPWTTNPDYPSIQYPNIMRAGTRYAQIHFLGERWRLENSTDTSHRVIRRDNPIIVPLTQVAPKFVFIVLNVRFTNYKFTTISPFGNSGTSNVILQGGKIVINGKDLTSIKILQTHNSEAQGKFTLGSSINRVLANVTYSNISQVKTDIWRYKKYDSFIFSQGARYTNGVPLLRSTPGGMYPSYNYSLTDNSIKVYNDTMYRYIPITVASIAYRTMGTPINGVPVYNFPDIYYTDIKYPLLIQEAGYSVGIASAPTPFALLDTAAFSGLYIDKDGIKGDFKGKMMPVYNNLNAPTYLVELTKNSYTPTFTMVKEGVLEFEQDLVDIVSTRNQESLLVGVNIINEGTLLLNNIHWPGFTAGGGGFRIFSSDIGCPVWSDPSSAVFGLIKLTTGSEVLLAHGYINASLKMMINVGFGPDGRPKYVASACVVSAYVTISLKKVGSTLKIITRAVTEVDQLIEDPTARIVYSGFKLQWLNAPRVNVAITKLQS